MKPHEVRRLHFIHRGEVRGAEVHDLVFRVPAGVVVTLHELVLSEVARDVRHPEARIDVRVGRHHQSLETRIGMDPVDLSWFDLRVGSYQTMETKSDEPFKEAQIKVRLAVADRGWVSDDAELVTEIVPGLNDEAMRAFVRGATYEQLQDMMVTTRYDVMHRVRDAAGEHLSVHRSRDAAIAACRRRTDAVDVERVDGTVVFRAGE